MTQISGAWSAELGRLVEEVAQRTAILTVQLLRAGPAGSETYERPTRPDAGAGGRHGARFGGVTDTGELEHDERPTG